MAKINPAYSVSMNSVVPKKEIIEHFVKYYGEEYREQITKRINDLNVDLVPMDLAGFKIKESFKEKYKGNPDVDWEEQAKEMLTNIRKLVNRQKGFDVEKLKSDADILTALGFDVSKIFATKKETGETYLANTNETQRLYNYIKASRIEKKIKAINVDSFLTNYALSRDENDAEFVKWKLNKSTKSFLQDICEAKGPCDLWTDEFSEYFLDGVNKLFGKELKSMKDFLEDKSLGTFHRVIKSYMRQSSFELNKNNIDKKEYGDKVEEDMTIFNSSNILGGFHNCHNRLILPLDTRLNMNTVLHEINHALGNKEYNKDITNFNKASVGLNEIVNEYLTVKSIGNKESFQNSSLSEFKECGYSSMVKFMDKFLNKYERIFQKCQMSGDAPKVLKNFIGENNFKRLTTLCNLIEKQNFCQIILEKEKGLENLQDLLNSYRENPDNPLYEKNIKDLKLLDFVDNFTADLIEHYSEFEKGNIVDVQTRQTVVQEQETEMTVDT